MEDADETPQNAEGAGGRGVTLAGFLALRDRDELANAVYYCHDQRAETDGAEAVGYCAAEGASRCAGRDSSVRRGFPAAEEPRAVDASDGGVDCVLEPLGDPVGGEGDEGY